MEACVRSAVSHVPLVAAIAVLFLAGAFTSSASAFQEPVTIDQLPTQPVVGESVTFTDTAGSDCVQTYTFTVDGTALPPPR